MILYKKLIKTGVSFFRCSRLLVKSDRINALRKQYDAFLEEDKKRKERNDIIINKLDKMRYSNTPVALRTMPTLQIKQQTGLYSKGKPLEKSSIYDRYLSSPIQQLPLEISKKHLDDSIMLQEITKKYILIPKCSSRFVNEYPEALKPVMESDIDWKSKYDVLNQLKQNDKAEREEEKNSSIKEMNHLKSYEPFMEVSHHKPIVSNYVSGIPVTHQHQLAQHTDETPEKDVVDTKPNSNLKIIEPYVDTAITSNGICENNKTQNTFSEVTNNLECKVNTLNLDQGITESMQFNNSVEKIKQQIDSNVDSLINKTLEYSEINSNNDHTSNEYLRHEESLETHGENIAQGSIEGLVEAVIVPHNNNSIQEMKPENFIEESTNSKNIRPDQEFKLPDELEYPIEIINVQDFTPDENVNLQDGVNINPHFDREDPVVRNESQNEAVVEAENPNHVSGIEAFDAEQREMFYSEHPNENCAYDQANPENTYQEYPPQNENYQQNEQYGYYQDVPPDQTYPTEVNEFEETSQPYDQTYQEQYAAYDPEYMQQETYEQPPQEYGEIQEMNPNIQPEIEQLQYEQLNYEPQSVEQQLDNEQGYTVNEELDKTHSQLADNTENGESKNVTSQALENSEVQENIIEEDTLNN